MPIRLNIFLIITLIFPAVFLSQAPGYMGKKFTAGYGFNMSPVGLTSRVETVFDKNDSAASIFEMVFLHEGYFDYCITSHWQVGGSVKYYKTTYDNLVTIPGYGKPAGDYTINGLTFTGYAKYYYNPYVAPWGKYLTAGLAIKTRQTIYDEYMYFKSTTNGHDTLISDFGQQKKWHVGFDFLIGKGRSMVIGNKFIFEYGVNTHLFAAFYKIEHLMFGPFDFSKISVDKTDYIEKTSRRKGYDINCLNVFIKVGYMF